MKTTVFLFTGQGSQYPEMGKELATLHPETRHVYECGSDILGFDIAKMCFEGSDSDLAKTSTSQPCIFATSMVAYECAVKFGIEYSAVVGHSLGEYSAMVASGMVGLEDCFKMLKIRSELMQNTAQNFPGAMCAVLGIDCNEISDICCSVNGYVAPVNFNTPSQTVIAGETPAVAEAIFKLNEKGAKTIKLAVNAGFHSDLMKDAAIDYKVALAPFRFKSPRIAYYSNLTGDKLSDFSDMPTYLSDHLISPVRFVDELQALKRDGFNKFVELGPNKTLTGLVRKTIKDDIIAVNIENEKTLNRALHSLGLSSEKD